MKLRVKVIPANSEEPTEIKVLEGDTILSILQGAMGGGYIEPVHTQSLVDEGKMMLVDEDGWSKNLPVNSRAMKESRYPGLILGTALIVGERIYRGRRTGDITGYPGQ